MSLTLPKRVPEVGFYYHYKHDPAGPVDNYAYEVLGVGFHTEDNFREGEAHFVIYRPLYPSSVYKAEQGLGVPCFDARPLEMWMGQVEKDGVSIPRFTKITDPATISELGDIRDEIYK